MDYKALARSYHTAVSNYDQATVTKMVHESYIQHNPKVPTGRAAFVGMLPKLKEHQTKIVNQRMLSDGRHIAMHHVWKNAAPFGGKEMAAFHIIRFDADDLIVEHWSVMAEMVNPNLSGRSLVDGETQFCDLENTHENKEKIAKLFGRLIHAKPDAALDAIKDAFVPDFHQHHPNLKDGMHSYKSLFEGSKPIVAYHKQHKVIGDGNFVLSISEGTFSGKPTAFYDLFRLSKGLIQEHWNIYQEIPSVNLANANTMFNF